MQIFFVRALVVSLRRLFCRCREGCVLWLSLFLGIFTYILINKILNFIYSGSCMFLWVEDKNHVNSSQVCGGLVSTEDLCMLLSRGVRGLSPGKFWISRMQEKPNDTFLYLQDTWPDSLTEQQSPIPGRHHRHLLIMASTGFYVVDFAILQNFQIILYILSFIFLYAVFGFTIFSLISIKKWPQFSNQ